MATETSTHDRLLEVAWSLAAESSLDEVTLASIAKLAGVSRQTLYLHFRNRAGLMKAMALAHDQRAGFTERSAELLAADDAAAALVEYMRAWCAYIADIRPVARRLEAELLLGRDAGAAFRDRMEDLRRTIRIMVGRAGNRGLLVDGVDRDAAADLIWATCHFSNWRNLVEERGWSDERFTELCVETARRFLQLDG